MQYKYSFIVVTEKAADSSYTVAAGVHDSLIHFLFYPLSAITQPTFLLICLVYCATYITVNVIVTYCELKMLNPFWFKLIGAAVTNMGLGTVKDRYFALVIVTFIYKYVF